MVIRHQYENVYVKATKGVSILYSYLRGCSTTIIVTTIRDDRKADPTIHPFLTIINTGDHWVLSFVNHMNHSIVLLDPIQYAKGFTFNQTTVESLRIHNWATCVKYMGLQPNNDFNSCGYHVLAWCLQLARIKSMSSTWTPTAYDIRHRVRQIYRLLNYDVGFDDSITHMSVNKKGKRQGSATFRRWKKRNWLSTHSRAPKYPHLSSPHKHPVKPSSACSNIQPQASELSISQDRICSQNIQGMVSQQFKFVSILKWVTSHQPAAFCLQETHLTPEDTEKNMV